MNELEEMTGLKVDLQLTKTLLSYCPVKESNLPSVGDSDLQNEWVSARNDASNASIRNNFSTDENNRVKISSSARNNDRDDRERAL